MAQYENGIRKDSFINQTQAIYSCNFGALHLAEPGLTAGVRQNFGKSHVSRKLVQTRTILLSTLFC